MALIWEENIFRRNYNRIIKTLTKLDCHFLHLAYYCFSTGTRRGKKRKTKSKHQQNLAPESSKEEFFWVLFINSHFQRNVHGAPKLEGNFLYSINTSFCNQT